MSILCSKKFHNNSWLNSLLHRICWIFLKHILPILPPLEAANCLWKYFSKFFTHNAISSHTDLRWWWCGVSPLWVCRTIMKTVQIAFFRWRSRRVLSHLSIELHHIKDKLAKQIVFDFSTIMSVFTEQTWEIGKVLQPTISMFYQFEMRFRLWILELRRRLPSHPWLSRWNKKQGQQSNRAFLD